jgi:hypothetical protein
VKWDGNQGKGKKSDWWHNERYPIICCNYYRSAEAGGDSGGGWRVGWRRWGELSEMRALEIAMYSRKSLISTLFDFKNGSLTLSPDSCLNLFL